MRIFKFAVLTMAACVCLSGADLYAGSPLVFQTAYLPVYGFTPSCANGVCQPAAAYAASTYYPSQPIYYSGTTLPTNGTVIYTSPVSVGTYSAPSTSYTVGGSSCGPGGCPVYVTPGTSPVSVGNSVQYLSPGCTTGNCPTVPTYNTYRVVPSYTTMPSPAVSTPAPSKSGGSTAVGRGSPFYP